MAVEVVVFDVGETLVDETNMWTRVAQAGGVTPFTLMAGLGATIALGRRHDDVWELLGIEQPAGTWTMDDWYADALPCIDRLRREGYRVCASGNTPAFVEDDLRAQFDAVGSSESWGVEKPDCGLLYASRGARRCRAWKDRLRGRSRGQRHRARARSGHGRGAHPPRAVGVSASSASGGDPDRVARRAAGALR